MFGVRPFVCAGITAGTLVGFTFLTQKICEHGDILDIPSTQVHPDVIFRKFDTQVIDRRFSSKHFPDIDLSKSESNPGDMLASFYINYFGKKSIMLGQNRINEFDINRNITALRQHHDKFELIGCCSLISFLAHKTQPGFRIIPIFFLGMYGALSISSIVSRQLNLCGAIKTTSYKGLVDARNFSADTSNDSWISTIFLLDELPVSYEKRLINKEITKRDMYHY